MRFHARLAACLTAVAMVVPTGLIVAAPTLAQAKATPHHRTIPFHSDFGCCGGVPVGCGYYGTVSQRRACVDTYYLANTRMSRWEHDCLIVAVSTAFGVGVGGLIGGFAARAVAAAVVGGSAGGCLASVLNS